MIDLLALLSGGVVGFMLGLVGGGGSILATPLLLYVVGIAQPHIAIGTGAFAVSVNAFANFAGHLRAGNVRRGNAVAFALFGTFGAITGSTVGKSVDGARLLSLFAIVMIGVGALMLWSAGRRGETTEANDVDRAVIPAVTWKLAGIAFAVGLLSGSFGIGGGFLIVPGLLLATGMPLLDAIGTSLFAVGTFGLATASNYALSGLIDWPIALEYIAGGLVGGWLGMKLACHLACYRGALNRVFTIVIFTVAGYTLYRTRGTWTL